MNANLQKYLKYKSKYLDLKNELEGGGAFRDKISKVATYINKNKQAAKKSMDDFRNNRIEEESSEEMLREKINYNIFKHDEIVISLKILALEFKINFIPVYEKRGITPEERYLRFQQKFYESIRIYDEKRTKMLNEINIVIDQQYKLIGQLLTIVKESKYTMLSWDKISEIFNSTNFIALGIDNFIRFIQESNYKVEKAKLDKLNEEKKAIDDKIEKSVDRISQLHIKLESKKDPTKKPIKLNLKNTKESDDTSDDLENMMSKKGRPDPSGPSKSSRLRPSDPLDPSDPSDPLGPSSDDFDCEKLKKNIKILCDHYADIKNYNHLLKMRIEEVFSSVNTMVKRINIDANEEHILTSEDIKEHSENYENYKKQDNITKSGNIILQQIQDAKNLEEKKKLVIKFKHYPIVKQNYGYLL